MRNTDAPAAAPPAFTHQQILRVISGILLCILLAAIDQTVVVPAVPAIAAELQGFGHLSWIVSAYLLTSTAATPIYGKLSDIYGRRALLLPALALFALASVLCAVAQSLAQLILFRALQGIGGAGLMAMAQAAIADVVSPRERGRYQGYMASVWGVASIAGPVLGGYVTDHLSWRWIFWINLPIALIAMVLCNRALKLLKAGHVRTRIVTLARRRQLRGEASRTLWGRGATDRRRDGVARAAELRRDGHKVGFALGGRARARRPCPDRGTRSLRTPRTRPAAPA
jgi:multidrug resistance protein